MTSPLTLPELELNGETGAFAATWETRQLDDNRRIVTLRLEAEAPTEFPDVSLRWKIPAIDVAATWRPGIGERGLGVDWGQGFTSHATWQAPVVALYDLTGRNRLSFAASDALNPLEIHAGVEEETATLLCTIKPFPKMKPVLASYELQILLDARPVAYYQSLREIAQWWAAQPGYEPAPVPAIARLPMLSTWYSFHQNLEVEPVLDECRRAKALGCEAVIVDDGWQTLDGGRGYAYCGDWQSDRIPEMRAFVDAVHQTGMQFLLWYSVPFVGQHSKAYTRFRDCFLDEGKRGFHSLDPRFPHVREYLIETYETALREWDLDGFKLDFVDAFSGPRATETGGGRDFDSVEAATDALLTQVMQRLRAIKPDIMIEFRQSYIGPLMRKYGNMFRAGDCPNNALGNRQRVLDIRLLCDDTAAHADMLMWHPDEPVESAALQLLAILFSVPQVSMKLANLPADHAQMLRFWLDFWREHRDVLLDGELSPLRPESNFPVVTARTAEKWLAAVYEDAIVPLEIEDQTQLFLVNATRGARAIVEVRASAGKWKFETLDTCGGAVETGELELTQGVMALTIPAGGLWRASRAR